MTLESGVTPDIEPGAPLLEQAAKTYTGPEAQLLSFGEPSGVRVPDRWPDYAALGITMADVASLIAMATDTELNEADSNDPTVWAPIHAWRALAQLGATEAARPLAELIAQYPDDDWVLQELPDVYALLGSEALPALADIVSDQTVDAMGRITAVEAISRLGRRHAGALADCKTVLRDQLSRYAQEPDHLNGFVINALVDLNAVEHVDLIRAAFRAGAVDETILGDIEDVEIEFGLRSERATIRPPTWLSDMVHARERPPAPERRQRKVGRNEPCPCGSGKKYKRCCGRT